MEVHVHNCNEENLTVAHLFNNLDLAVCYCVAFGDYRSPPIPVFGKNLEDCDCPPAIVLSDTLLAFNYRQGKNLRGMASVLNKRDVKTHRMPV